MNTKKIDNYLSAGFYPSFLVSLIKETKNITFLEYCIELLNSFISFIKTGETINKNLSQEKNIINQFNIELLNLINNVKTVNELYFIERMLHILLYIHKESIYTSKDMKDLIKLSIINAKKEFNNKLKIMNINEFNYTHMGNSFYSFLDSEKTVKQFKDDYLKFVRSNNLYAIKDLLFKNQEFSLKEFINGDLPLEELMEEINREQSLIKDASLYKNLFANEALLTTEELEEKKEYLAKQEEEKLKKEQEEALKPIDFIQTYLERNNLLPKNEFEELENRQSIYDAEIKKQKTEILTETLERYSNLYLKYNEYVNTLYKYLKIKDISKLEIKENKIKLILEHEQIEKNIVECSYVNSEAVMLTLVEYLNNKISDIVALLSVYNSYLMEQNRIKNILYENLNEKNLESSEEVNHSLEK